MTDRLQQITIPVQRDPLEAPMPQTLAWLAMPRRWDLLSWVAAGVWPQAPGLQDCCGRSLVHSPLPPAPRREC